MALVTNLDTANPNSVLDGPRKYQGTLASFARPANATPYAAGDVISDSASVAAALEFPLCARRLGGGGAVLRAHLSVDVNIATPPAFDLYVFSVEPTNHLDNAALALADADLVAIHAAIVFATASAKVVNAAASPAGALHYTATIDLAHPYVCAADSKNLYGLLVTRTNFTPVTGAKFVVGLELDLD